MTRYDAIIIGTGQAGPALARRLAGADMQVAIVERDRFGGTCVNTGCTPTKTLVASAYAAHLARRGAEFGLRIGGDVGVDMKRIKARKDHVSGLATRGVERSLKTLENCRVYEGHARFVGPRDVQVGTEILSAERIFINVGGRAAVPAISGGGLKADDPCIRAMKVLGATVVLPKPLDVPVFLASLREVLRVDAPNPVSIKAGGM
jgi:pyruvate/2-oxoglutarate dehydrogenase complex dihydrolipoamide dehydrogenase (E3) component